MCKISLWPRPNNSHVRILRKMTTTPVGHKISIMQPLDVVKPRNACSWSNWGLTIFLQWSLILQVRVIVQFCAPPPGGCTMAILYIAPGGTKFKLHVECHCCWLLLTSTRWRRCHQPASQPANQPTSQPKQFCAAPPVGDAN